MVMKLSEMQIILLVSASQRDNGSLLPVRTDADKHHARIDRSIAGLMRRGLAIEVAVREDCQVWREGKGMKSGVAITPLGRDIIDKMSEPGFLRTIPVPAVMPPREGSKQSLLLELLRHPDGTNLAKMGEATGWLPHTTRAALTGLRKRGFPISTHKVDGATHYSISPTAGD
ncbi:DUF3489 domain-containing protein [Aquisediminimonas sediminicola]|uniref:DUF3489 domain-containing protein n=1 Tax=Alteraquisediminimonas sediminicola TaxID=2676787 RepID=UPI001C8E2B43|nr:DUF3489 domain-containing protein [Aquisediminimonas sediminicola]